MNSIFTSFWEFLKPHYFHHFANEGVPVRKKWGINSLHNIAIQSEEIILILRMWQRRSLSEHNDSKSWCIDSKSWCHERMWQRMWQRGSLSEHNDSKSWCIDSKSWSHERQVRFLLKCQTSTRTAPRTRAFTNLRDDRHAWTDQNSLTGMDRQWVQK